MAKPTFTLRTPKEEESIIYLRYRFKAATLTYPIDEKIETRYWNKKLKRADPAFQLPKLIHLNKRLDQITKRVEAYLEECKIKELIPSKVGLKNYLDKKAKNKVEVHLFSAYFKQYNDLRKASRKYSASTIKIDNYSLNKVLEYEDEKGKLLFDDIDVNFLYSFMELNSHLKKNTISRIISCIVSVIIQAVEDGLTENKKFRSKHFTAPQEKISNIYYNEIELQELYFCEPPSRLRKAKDAFVAGCYLGLRYTDLKRISQDINKYLYKDEDGDQFISLRICKRGPLVDIPVNTVVQDIINKHNGFPKIPNNQNFNVNIKRICKNAGFNSKHLREHKVDGEIVRVWHEKWEISGTHTMRRSFCTNAYLSGMPSLEIMKFSGHSSESSFLRYIAISSKENAKRSAKNPFFNRKFEEE